MFRLFWFCAILLAVAWLLPLHVLPWMSWHNEILALAAIQVGCALALMRRANPGSAAFVVPGIAFVPLLVAGVALVQFLAGRIVFAGSMLVIASYALVCIAAAVAGRACGEGALDAPVPVLRVTAQVLIAVALLQVVVVAAQTFLLWSDSEWVARTAYETRGGGNVAQPNQAALLFVMAMAATLFLRDLKTLGTGSFAALMLVLAGGLATTQSRSGLLAVAVLLAWALVRHRAALPRHLGAAFAFAVVTVGAFALWPALMNAYWGSDTGEVSLTTSGRIAMWTQLLPAVGMRPWTGWGVMQVAEAQNAIADRHDAVMAATFSHNVFLDLVLWMGIPAMLIVVAMLLAWLWPRVRGARTPDTWFCVALALPMAVQSLTEFPYSYAYIVLPVFFALGVLDAKVGRGPTFRVPRPLLASVLALWTAATAWSVVEYVRIEEDFRVARFEALRVGQTPAAYEAPQTHLLTQLDALLRATRVKAVPGMPAQDIALLRDVAMLHPWGATNFRYATALALNGQMDEAVRQFQVLRALQGQKTFDRLMQVIDEMAVEYPVLKQLRQP